MPVKNASPFLEACLDSILTQSYANWELRAIDDHSEDGSKTILEKYAEKDERIFVGSNPSRGIIPALRYAFEKSKGDYIHRMDADDLMVGGKLEKLLGILHSRTSQPPKGGAAAHKSLSNSIKKNKPGHLATGLVEYFREEGPLGDGYQKYTRWLNRLTRKGENFKDIYKECVIPSPCWMIGREDFIRLGAFDADVYPEDYDLCFRFYKAGLKVLGVDEVLHLWRDHAGRSSRTDPNYSDNRFLVLKLRYFLELDFDEGKTLFVWGAGKKGKLLAKMLLEKGVPFRWVSNNVKKQRVPIYGVTVEDFGVLKAVGNAQVIVTVANREEQGEIGVFLGAVAADDRPTAMSSQVRVFFFC